MATAIVNLNSYRRAAAKAVPGTDCGKVCAGTRKNAAGRKTRNKTIAPVLQIPTEANKEQRLAAAVALYGDECRDAAFNFALDTAKWGITGSILIGTPCLDGGDGAYLQACGLYLDEPQAAVRILRRMIEHFEKQALDDRNAAAMAQAQPVKRPAFEVAL